MKANAARDSEILQSLSHEINYLWYLGTRDLQESCRPMIGSFVIKEGYISAVPDYPVLKEISS